VALSPHPKRLVGFVTKAHVSLPLSKEIVIMNKLATKRSIRQLVKDSKGATMVEYALMLALILAVAAGIVRLLGTTVNTAVNSANSSFAPH
jgi:Flp pilus assembly pilin Flp